MKPARVYITILLLFFGYHASAQNSLSLTLTRLQKQATEQPFEKVYLHTDKPYYAAGDTIWFKGYTVAGAEHVPSAISGVLHVDLINSSNYYTQSIKLPIVSGLSYGDLVLPDTLTEGTYRIRAWTNWMLNAGPDNFFNKPVRIINALIPKKDLKTKENKAGKFDIQFFPEGGYLINGAATKVAFKVTAPNGLGKNVKGYIVDDKGNNMGEFESTHQGMGSFKFAPQAGSTYSAVIAGTGNADVKVPLPKAKDSGYLLNVNNTDSLTIAVKVTRINVTEGFTLLAQSGGEVFFRANAPAGQIISQVNIDKSKLPSGIIRLTLFSSSGEPMNERLVFIQNSDKLNLSIKTVQLSYKTGEKVKVDLGAKDAAGQPVSGSFSVSVINADEVPVDEAGEYTILSSLLLTSDLKGYVEQPNYYFANINKKTAADLDLLMLTQGYSRYEWKALMNDKPPATVYLPEKDLTISGRVTKNGSKPSINYNVLLTGPAAFGLRDTVTNADGTFAFKNLHFNDDTKFTVRTSAPGGKDNAIIEVDNQPVAPVDHYNLGQQRAATDTATLSTYARISNKIYEQEVKSGIRGRLLQEVNIKRTPIKSPREIEEEEDTQFSANLNGKGKADQIFTTKDLEEFKGADLFTTLEGRLHGIDVVYKPMSGTSLYIKRQSGYKGVLQPMTIIVNGMVGATVPFPEEVASVEILTSAGSRAIYGHDGVNGVVIITTKTGGNVKESHGSPGAVSFTTKGFYKAHEFYSPAYNVTETKAPDLRTTIYWEPLLETDKDGNTSFQYFNADTKGDYRVVVEGMDDNGTIGRQVYTYRVE